MNSARELRLLMGAAFLLLAFSPGCNKGNHKAVRAASAQNSRNRFHLSSTAFQDGARIAAAFTCEGEDISPPLAWNGAPRSAKSFVLIVTDPDAPSGEFTHWLLYGLAASAESLPQNLPPQSQLASGAAQGTNDFGKLGYGGPCPPPGPEHHYRFVLYALDAELALKPGAHRAQVDAAIQGHILAQAELSGLAGR